MTRLKSARRFLLPPWLRFLNKSIRSYRKLSAINRDLHLPSLDPNPLRHRKASDTLFILGSGASVLSYTAEEWSTISANDSLGFNYWIVHPFVPTHYLFEFCKDERDMACFTHNLSARADYTSRSSIFLKDAERFEPEIIKKYVETLPLEKSNPLNLIWDAEIVGQTVSEFEHSLSGLNRLGCFSEGRYWAIPRNRATLFLAINLAVRAGYKNIVMCGVDLNNTDYFFRADSFAASLSGLCVPPANQFGAVHKTNDPHYGELTISVILDVFDKIVLQPRGIVLSVAKDTSALYPRFKSYFEA